MDMLTAIHKLCRALKTYYRFNGNYITPRNHARLDDWRRRFMSKGWKKANPKIPNSLQQPLRLPGWIPGAALVGATFTIDNCRCS